VRQVNGTMESARERRGEECVCKCVSNRLRKRGHEVWDGRRVRKVFLVRGAAGTCRVGIGGEEYERSDDEMWTGYSGSSKCPASALTPRRAAQVGLSAFPLATE
jgi:hypothetical protein